MQIFTLADLFLILLIAALCFISGRQYLKSNERGNHSANVLAHIRELEILLERAETAQRGYVLTARRNFFAPYADSKRGSFEEIELIEDLVSDNRDQATLQRL